MAYDPKESLTGSAVNQTNHKLTLYLLVCCVVTCLASFQFGYNIGVTNLPTQHILEFYLRSSWSTEYEDFKNATVELQSAEADLRMGEKAYFDKLEIISTKKLQLNDFKNTTQLLPDDAEYKKSVADFEKQIDDLNAEILDKNSTYIAKKDELEARLKEFNNKMNDFKNTTQLLPDDAEYKKSVADFEKQIDDLNAEIFDKNSTYAAKKDELEIKLEDIKRKRDDFKNTTQLLPEADEYKKNLANFEKQIDDLNAEILDKNKTYIAEKDELEARLKEFNKKRDDFESYKKVLWTITNCLFVLGGMIGAICSKFISDSFGRRNSIILHNVFSMIGSLLVVLSNQVNHLSLIKISRFLYGVQGGLACSLVPSYLNEISPSNLRGVTGVINQLCITVGILVSQILGFRQILGTESSWNYLLGLPIFPAVIGSICLLLFFPETPHELVKKNSDEAAKTALKRLRNQTKITGEFEQIKNEVNQNSNISALSVVQLLKDKRLHWPLATGIIVHLSQQLCGINAIFFYSEGIFRGSGIHDEEIQYAVMATGLINVVSTLIAVPLIEKLGRRPLLIVPMIIMILDFIAMTVCLKFAETDKTFSYIGIACVLLFIICFAVGLGPIPFLFVAECFEPHAKSIAMAVCIFFNWSSNLLLVLAFPYLNILLGPYVFLVFAVIVSCSLAFIIKKVPETKGRTVEQLLVQFNSGRFHYTQPSSSDIHMRNLNNEERI